MEAFHLSCRYLGEVAVGGAAEDLGEEVDSLRFVEEVVFPALTVGCPTASLSGFIDPLQEHGLVHI